MRKQFGYITKTLLLASFIGGVSGCSDSYNDQSGLSDENIIKVGGIELDDVEVLTRAERQNAETIDWLVAPLKAGLDITYGNILINDQNREEQHNQRVAILTLTDNTTNPATYTFKYRDEQKDAIWHNNGKHYFQGVHVPERIRYTSDVSEVEGAGKAPGLTSDQHNDAAPIEKEKESELGNYTLLSHYLGMPADCKITATISRIKLPFRHRLARVVAFVLIDPQLNTKLKGYTATVKDSEGKITSQDDPNTTSFRFNNVWVLQGVRDVVDGTSNHHTLTPKWIQSRKVIPHFDGERGSYSYKDNKNLEDEEDFILYTLTDQNNEITDVYPTSSDWVTIHKATPDAKGLKNGYKAINYGKVPVYDIIVRPTYTDQDHVMYDEENYSSNKASLANMKNSIDFEIALENGLNYEKTFEFDLNANYQTVVYLRISREQVDYNDAGSEIWTEAKNNDDWYGVDNKNGNILSKAGSSWQRAFTYNATVSSDKVTDGGFYNENTTGADGTAGQYLSEATWKEYFAQAYEGGKHHGDYFILTSDITINAQDLPANFVFTGHLDAQDKTITLTGLNEDTYETTTDYNNTTLYYKKSVSDVGHTLFVMPALYICEEVAQAKPIFRRNISSGSGNTIPGGGGKMTPVSPTLYDVMHNDVVYYEKVGDDYKEWNPRPWTFYTHRISASSLFCGLNGNYTTAQEKAEKENMNIYNNPAVKWEANVHKEKNNFWVPTLGYRAEVLNTVVSVGTIFPAEMAADAVTGNVQNCFNKVGSEKVAVTYDPTNIPQYK